MWQCGPVKKIVARFMNLPFILILLVLASYIQGAWQSPVLAQANIGYNRITSVKEGRGSRSVTLQAEKPGTIPRPIIRFLPGENGDTILVADFHGLLWQMPTRVIEVNSSFNTTSNTTKKGIKLVRIGKFQEMPPVCRVAIISSDPEKLRSVSFDSKPGKLTIKWSSWLSSRSGHGPRVAPNYEQSQHGSRDIRKIASAPPLAPPIGSLDASTVGKYESQDQRLGLRPPIGMQAPEAGKFAPAETEKKGLLSKFFRKAKRSYKNLTEQEAVPIAPKVASSDKRNVVESRASKDGEASVQKQPENLSPAPTITLNKTGDEAITIKIKSDRASDLTFKSFRLSNPNRYVIDFDNLEALARSGVPTLPPASGNTAGSVLLNGLRVGSPTVKDKTVGRMVLDLVDRDGSETSVFEDLDQATSTLTIVVGRLDNPLKGITAPANSTIVLDAGHGGSDPGAMRGHDREKEITLAIAKKTRDYLKQKGVKVHMTRDGDETVSLADRVALTNKVNPDAFLSVHINSLESTSDIHGIETYYQTPQSLRLANQIHKSLVSGLKAPDRKVRKARFYVVNRTSVPAVLAEVGFITHKDERKKLVTNEYQSEIAGALARGVLLYLKENNMVATNSQPNSQPAPVKSEMKDDIAANQSNLSNGEGKNSKKQGTISNLSRLAQKSLGIKVR